MGRFARVDRHWVRDARYCALTPAAQHLLGLLLLQPEITKCGVLTLAPTRLARQAAGLDPASIETSVHELVAGGFVARDVRTDEVAVVGFFDLDGVGRHAPSLKRAAADWGSIHSPVLRDVVAAQVPGEVRAGWPDSVLQLAVPDIAAALRGQPVEPAARLPFPQSTSETTDCSEFSSKPPGRHLSTAAPSDRAERETNVLVAIVDSRISRTRKVGTVIHNERAYRRAVVDDVRRELWTAIVRAVADNPHLDSSTVAELLDHSPGAPVGCGDCDGGFVDDVDGPGYCPRCHPMARR